MSVIYSVCRRVGTVVNCSQREASLSVVARKKKKKREKFSTLLTKLDSAPYNFIHTYTYTHTYR